MSTGELVDQEHVAGGELAELATGEQLAGVVWWLPPELVLADLRRRPFPCPLALLGPAQRRGMVLRDEHGRRIYDSRPGRPDEGTEPPLTIGH